ncbi:hypothetical protein CAEBREN_10590 [Caenorhabditis brenneri]|uniref:Uncharacterized protein n=1 Tax=Caenorhabditis brenneri TaxID=135651 RepID=G0MJ96_CAEBE|nr:hypothetical protein CAEBREN_10590 [Caenorhabditis brenneri]
MISIWDLLSPDEQEMYKRLEDKFSPSDAIWYLKRLCHLKQSYCGSGRQALEDTCSKSSGLDSKACNVIIDQVMEKYCGENKNSRACKNESFPSKDGVTLASDALVATAEATTKGKMNMMLIGGVAAVVIFIIIAIGLFFFCSSSSSPPPPPPQQARTPTSSGKRKHKKKKNKKRKKAKTTTSGANSTTKTPEEIV